MFVNRKARARLYEMALQQVTEAWNRGYFNKVFRLTTKEDGNTPEYAFDDERWKHTKPSMTLEVDSDGDMTAMIYIPSSCGCCPPDECYYDIRLDEE